MSRAPMTAVLLALVASVGLVEPLFCAARERVLPKVGYDRPGPYEMHVLEFPDLLDGTRDDRPVPIKLFFPDRGGPFPLVVVSHGGGGSWDASWTQVEHLVSHGYVAAATEHVYSNAKRWKHYMRRDGFRKGFWGGMQFMTRDRRAVLGRPRDVSFAIDKAEGWNRTLPLLRGRIDLSRVAVMGHSFGAYTTLVACGARPGHRYLLPPLSATSPLLRGLADARIDVGVAMSPQGPNSTFFDEGSYRTIDRPLLCFSGDRDRQKAADGSSLPASQRLEAFRRFPKGDKYLLWLARANHLGFSHCPHRPLFVPNLALEDQQRISKTMILVFLDAYLKGSKDARAHLTDAYANTLTGRIVSRVTWYQR